MTEKPPQQTPYARHVFICTGESCDRERNGRWLYRRLTNLLGDLGRYENPQRVKRGTTECLGICAGGPIMVVYPEGIWYHHLTEEKLARIVEEHLRDGHPVEDYIFHRLSDE